MDNIELMHPFTLQEVKKATFDNPPLKASGSDGFPSEFFQKCWIFMGTNIHKVVEAFRQKGQFVKEINNTVISLIPKKQDC